MTYADQWLIVRRSRTLPGGYRVVASRLKEAEARARAAGYKTPHQAMSKAELIEHRLAALNSTASATLDMTGEAEK